MKESEEQFFEKLKATFSIEAEEHLQALSDGLLALEANPPSAEQAQIVETIFRKAHTLKGAARSVNLRSIQNVCQALEDLLALLLCCLTIKSEPMKIIQIHSLPTYRKLSLQRSGELGDLRREAVLEQVLQKVLIADILSSMKKLSPLVAREDRNP